MLLYQLQVKFSRIKCYQFIKRKTTFGINKLEFNLKAK